MGINLDWHFYLDFTDKQGTSGPDTKNVTVTAKSGLRKQVIAHFKGISMNINFIITLNAWDQIWAGIFTWALLINRAHQDPPFTKMVTVTAKTGFRQQMIRHFKDIYQIYRWLVSWYTFCFWQVNCNQFWLENVRKIGKCLYFHRQWPISDPKWPQNKKLPT